MVEYTGQERRSFERINISLPVTFLLFDTMESKKITEIISAQAQNISAGGLLIETEKISVEWINALIAGKIKLILEFILPGFEESIKTSGNVTWMARRKAIEDGTEPYLIGLKFVEINDNDRDKINTFVSKCVNK